jgi:hypothetical protein
MRDYVGTQPGTVPRMGDLSVEEMLIRQRDDAVTDRDAPLRERDAANTRA